MAEEISNLAVTTLNGAINGSVTSITLTSASAMPATGNFRLKVDNEIMVCTGRTGNVCTVQRGQEGTTATSHSDLAPVKLVLTKQALFNLILERKNAPSIEDYGAKAQVGFDNTAAIQNALDDAPNVYGKVVVPSNKTYEADSTITVPTKTVLELDGTLKCTASPNLGGAFILFKNGASQGLDGGMKGNGRILGNMKTTWVIIIDSWRGGRFDNFTFGEGTFGGMLLQDTNGVDTDSNEFRGINHRNNSSLGVDEYDISKVAYGLTGTAGRVTDNNFYGIQMIGGIRPATTPTADDGGIGINIVNADRNTFYSPKLYSHFTVSDGAGKSLKWTHGIKIFADVDIDGASGNVFYNPYIEATTSGGDPNGTANTTWKFYFLHATVETTSHADWTQVWLAQMSLDASGANARRATTVLNGTGTMHGFQWRAPKNTIGTTGQMNLDSGMTAGLVEVHDNAEKARVSLNGGTGVTVVALEDLA